MKEIILLSAIIFFVSIVSSQEVEIEGALKIGDVNNVNPDPGTVRFNPNTNDFESWNGQWVSLTNPAKPKGSGMVTDIDGNQYLTVTIGGQTWMRENLRVTRYQNGEPIPEVLLNSDWTGLTTGAWCWYENDPEKDLPYGKL